MFDDLIKQLDNWLWNYTVKKHTGLPDASHLILQYDWCDMILWNKDDVPGLVEKPTIANLESITNEYLNAENKRTTVKPEQWERVANIIVDKGLNRIGKEGFGTDTAGINYLFGNSSTPSEDAADDQLNNQVLAKSFASAGDKGHVVASKTSQFMMPVTSADYIGDIKEAGLATGNNPPTDDLITRYTFPTVAVSNPSLLTAMTTILYRNGTVS